ncbi:MAG: tRNA epoxyqueuosine(34) reductase QueG [Flavobacteriales bacterium]
MDSSIKSYKTQINEEAYRLGFSHCGFSKAEFLEEEAPRLEHWLNQNHHGEMAYMANHFDKRLDPRLLVDDAKTVVTLLFNYYTDQKQQPSAPKISKYAYGQDYHFVVKDKLKALLHYIRTNIGEVSGRGFVDSAPVMDKAWAQRSGLGWMGKNTNIINKERGSFFFIAELIIDLDIEPDKAVLDHCGTCTACIDACPTQAILAPYQIDGSKCISYFTIELKEAIPTEMKGKFDNWMFGCDVCQDVCPWNRFSKPHKEERFQPHPDLLEMTAADWDDLTEESFRKVFKHSALKRTKYKGLKRNLDFLK